MSQPSYLIVVDAAPYGSLACREALDVALALAAFDQSVTLLLRGAAVNGLAADQRPDAIEQKNLAKNLGAAGLYGVETILAIREDMQRYGIDPGATGVPVTLTGAAQVDTMMNSFDRVLQFG